MRWLAVTREDRVKPARLVAAIAVNLKELGYGG